MNDSSYKTESSFKELMKIIKILRSPDGCAWDRRQSIEDVAKYLMDEAYEVVEAIENKNMEAIMEESGDLLFQILFLSSIAEEAAEYSLSDVIESVTEKMIRRHPHVFADKKVCSISEIKMNWEEIKSSTENRKQKNAGFFTNITPSMPSLMKAQKIAEKASLIGFDWEKPDDVILKIEEELNEFKSALKCGNPELIKEEIGDIFFSLVNLCRFLDVNAEKAVNAAANKFIDRFHYIREQLLKQGKSLSDASLEEMNQLWLQSKP